MAARLHHFLLLAALLQVLATTTSASTAGDIAATGNGEKVRVEVYYESLCPYSARFVVNQLATAFREGLLDGADVTLVPYGNAKVGTFGAMSCQVCLISCFSLPITHVFSELFLTLLGCNLSKLQNTRFF
jgi:interferon gamma-inducible protein 30